MPSKSIGSATGALVRRECLAINDALNGFSNVHDSIHAARKAVRRLRALLALVAETALDLDQADNTLRRLGDGLSALRDAHVAVETCDRLSAQAPVPSWALVRGHLLQRRDRMLARALTGDPAFARRRASLARVAGRLQAQPWSSLTNREINKAMARSERRTAKAEKRAARTGDPQDLHRWRRRVRRLRMQLEALPALDSALGALIKRKGLGHQARALHALGDQLGRQQDLRMVRNLVRVMPGVPERRGLLAQIDAALAAALG